ncbi:phospholipid scramblase 1 [Lunasporangiospora selenospora]|uniref:Phospholipid scramblase 1 n=1 Tax=Lunasporangiospora selenospora TaxID=979761 RepID=A0A9P6FSV1_9FUNG|nr:phospholipid scramblase 1 [Lunasporangiospora selenospora]
MTLYLFGLAPNGLQSTINFTAQELASFKESFDAFDTNSDGSINARELRSLLRLVGEHVHTKSITDTMKEFDTNNDQGIDFNEFLALANKLIKNRTP